MIHRDEWGVPHIYGPTDASTSFGLAYAQAEDYFWQIEDTYLQVAGALRGGYRSVRVSGRIC
jgi:acyl-homoserine-lactone acylase